MVPESNMTDLLIRREVIQIHNKENAMWRVMEVEMGVSAKEQQGLATRSQKGQGRIWPKLRGYRAPRHLDFRLLTSNTAGEHISIVLSASLGYLVTATAGNRFSQEPLSSWQFSGAEEGCPLEVSLQPAGIPHSSQGGNCSDSPGEMRGLN